MTEDNYRPPSPESAGMIGDKKPMPWTKNGQRAGYDVSRSLAGCDKSCMDFDAGYEAKGKVPRREVNSDKGFA